MNIVLLSGGMDSTLGLFWAKQRLDRLIALTFEYGQVHSREVQAASRISQLAGVPHFIRHITDAMSTPTEPGAVVPGRNLLFLSLAANVVASQGGGQVIIGACKEDFEGFPDCRPEFFDAVNDLFKVSGLNVTVVTPLVNISKAQALKEMSSDPLVLQALAESHTCYEGTNPPCGKCSACGYRQAAFAEAGITDPV